MGRKNKTTLVFDFIRQGLSLYAACQKAGISTKDFYLLLAETPGLKEDFQLALADYADQCTDGIKELAQLLESGQLDNATAKLLIETNKWLAQKACPETFAGFSAGDDELNSVPAEIVVKFV